MNNSIKYFEICFENYLKDASWSNDGENREIVMDLEIGSKSRNLNLIKQSEKASTTITEIRIKLNIF